MSSTRARQAWFAAVGLVLALALGWVAVRSGPLAPVRVTVAEVTRGAVVPSLFGIGTVEARRSYLIGPTTAGRVAQVLVDVGDEVVAGQMLAEMEPVDLAARVSSQAAAAQRGRSAVVAAEAQVREAASRKELATEEARRATSLGRAGVVSQSLVDAALREQASASAQVAAAEAQLEVARRDVARLDAEVRGARQQRENVRLTAPVDGFVVARDAEPGSTVIAGQAVLRLQDPASLWLRVRIDQGRSAGLAVGLPARITRRAEPLQALSGRVARVEPTSDSVTEERVAHVAFDVLPAGISTGEMAEVTLQLPAVPDAVIVPTASIRYSGATPGVWLHVDGRLQFAPVRTGAEGLDGRIQVLEGLRAGDRVVVYSERDLAAGTRVTVVPSLPGGPR